MMRMYGFKIKGTDRLAKIVADDDGLFLLIDEFNSNLKIPYLNPDRLVLKAILDADSKNSLEFPSLGHFDASDLEIVELNVAVP